MPWIKIVPEKEATGELAEVYERIRKQRNSSQVDGTPPGLASLSPKAMWHAWELFWEIMRGPSSLTTRQREMVAVVTSLAARCKY